MAYSSGQNRGSGGGADKKFIDLLITDLITLSYETKRKYPPVKEAAEASQLKARSVGLKSDRIAESLLELSSEFIQPFVLGCDTKSPKIVQLSLTAMQRLIAQQAIHQGAATSIVAALWLLMEAGIEELKLLQTATLLVTTSSLVQHELLARVLVLCFRLHCSKESTVCNAAAATVRQLVCAVFDRVSSIESTSDQSPTSGQKVSEDELKQVGGKQAPPTSLSPPARDAYLLFQDFCQLLNSDPPLWLVGLTEITRTLCLELLEEVLLNFHTVFLTHTDFSFLLTEKVCPLVIKLFSPSLKYRTSRNTVNNSAASSSSLAPPPHPPPDKPCFPVVMRLLRVVSVLIRHYYKLLGTECEIFLSLLVKFLDPEKPSWQRATTLEVLAKVSTQPVLIRCFCEAYDMKPHSTKILRDIINGLSAFVQSQFMNNTIGGGASSTPAVQKPVESVGSVQVVVGGIPVVGGVTPQAGFYYRNVWIPLVVNITAPHVTHKPVYLDMLDKLEAPTVPDGYGLSLAFLCLLDIVNCVQGLIKVYDVSGRSSQLPPPTVTLSPTPPSSSTSPPQPSSSDPSTVDQSETLTDTQTDNKQDDDTSSQGSHEKQFHEELINSSWCGVLAALSMLLDACSDETASEAILKAIQSYSSMCGHLQLTTPRDAFITALCKSSLPPHYALHLLNLSPSDPKSVQPRPGNNSDQQSTGFQPIVSGGSYGGTGPHGWVGPHVGGGHGSDTSGGSNQIVAVGSALPSHIGQHPGPVMLTSKNIQCMRALLSLAHCHGVILGTAWHQVLTTLQHLVWILGLKPSSGGSLKPVNQASDNAHACITTAVMSDMPVLSSMLSRLFESSQYLDDVALHHLLDALCKLSTEAMEVGYANREPSLFAVAKLLETGLVNMSRIEVLWRPVTSHLLEVCQHTHQGLRMWAAEAVTALIKAALVYKYDEPHQLQQKLLAPLKDMSSIPHADIRQKQLECVLHVLQSNGDQLREGWPICLDVIGAVTKDQGDALIRIAFQSLQLVVTDFLPTMPCACLQVCVDVATKFGLQNKELNISLTAVGLLWNIADYFSQNKVKICQQLSGASEECKGGDDVQGSTAQIDQSRGVAAVTVAANGGAAGTVAANGGVAMTAGSEVVVVAGFDGLWMFLYTQLGELCVDLRPAVRKSAGQTLFSMLGAHGSLLQQQTWQTVLWKVLFPLLDKVKHLSTQASDSRDDQSAGGGGVKTVNILMHHSRDTAEKQWAETRFLTLGGVARVFNMKCPVLRQLGDFLRAWALLLEFIESSALCHNAEVALFALKSFQEILNITNINPYIPPSISQPLCATNIVKIPKNGTKHKHDEFKLLSSDKKRSTIASAPASVVVPTPLPADLLTSSTFGGDAADDMALWSNAWRVWRNIGTASTCPPLVGSGSSNYVPSQAFLSALIQTFPALYAHIRSQFVVAELQRLCVILHRALCVPVHSSATPFILPVGELSSLTPLQDAILAAIKVLTKEASASSSMTSSTSSDVMSPSMYPDLFEKLLSFVELSVHPPKFNRVEAKNNNSTRQDDYICINYVPFAEAVIELIVDLYRTTSSQPSVIQAHTLQHILTSLKLPLSLKYGCPAQSTWLLAINSLLSLLSAGLTIAYKHEVEFHGMWMELGVCLEEFLFSQHAAPQSLSVDDFQGDEAIDCKVIQLVRDDILPHSNKLPRDFVVRIMSVLNKGSIHSVTTSSFIDIESNKKLREEFAKICFETLLQFSFVSQSPGGVSSGTTLSRNQSSGASSSGSSSSLSLSTSTEEGTITHLAIESLLNRCKNVLQTFVADERLSGKCPLPRPRMTEMSFVLKAVSTLVTTLKRTRLNAVDTVIWDQVIDLYPALVDCTASSSANVCKSLRDALMEYKDLLARPTSTSTAASNGGS